MMDQDALRQRVERCGSSLPPVKHPWSSVADQHAPVPARAGEQASTACRTVARAGRAVEVYRLSRLARNHDVLNVNVTHLLCSPRTRGREL